MASTVLDIHCGCGFKTHSLEAAVKHSDETHHVIVSFSGTIKPTVSKPASKIVSKASPVIPQSHEESADYGVSAIQALRVKFGKR